MKELIIMMPVDAEFHVLHVIRNNIDRGTHDHVISTMGKYPTESQADWAYGQSWEWLHARLENDL